MTPLHFVRSIEVARVLVENGVNVNAKTNNGMTALHRLIRRRWDDYETQEKKIEIAKYLIENGADANARDQDNKTPFDYADDDGNFELAHYLLEVKKNAELQNLPPTGNGLDDCVICLTPKIGIYAVMPCGHASLCEPCWYKLKMGYHDHGNRCPTCRKSIRTFSKIYF